MTSTAPTKRSRDLVTARGGYSVVLRRTVKTFDDALDIANDVLFEKTGIRA